jgi:crossover junction endodeoxyribonuclease RusA
VSAVRFEVVGLPVQQGSKKHVGNGVMVEAAKGHKAWRAEVADAARDVADGRPFDGPLALTVHFRFPMPASRKAAVRRAGYGPKSTAPDLDKLIRAVGDSLQAGGLVADDARFCEITATKTEVRGWTGVEITVTDRLDWHNHGPSPRVHGKGEQG